MQGPCTLERKGHTLAVRVSGRNRTFPAGELRGVVVLSGRAGITSRLVAFLMGKGIPVSFPHTRCVIWNAGEIDPSVLTRKSVPEGVRTGTKGSLKAIDAFLEARKADIPRVSTAKGGAKGAREALVISLKALLGEDLEDAVLTIHRALEGVLLCGLSRRFVPPITPAAMRTFAAASVSLLSPVAGVIVGVFERNRKPKNTREWLLSLSEAMDGGLEAELEEFANKIASAFIYDLPEVPILKPSPARRGL